MPGFTHTTPECIQAINDANQRMREQHSQRMTQGLSQTATAPTVPDPTYLDTAQPENFEKFVKGKKRNKSIRRRFHCQTTC